MFDRIKKNMFLKAINDGLKQLESHATDENFFWAIEIYCQIFYILGTYMLFKGNKRGITVYAAGKQRVLFVGRFNSINQLQAGLIGAYSVREDTTPPPYDDLRNILAAEDPLKELMKLLRELIEQNLFSS